MINHHILIQSSQVKQDFDQVNKSEITSDKSIKHSVIESEEDGCKEKVMCNFSNNIIKCKYLSAL